MTPQDRNTAGKNRRMRSAPSPGSFEVLDAPSVDHFRDDRLERRQVTPVSTKPELVCDVARRTDGARTNRSPASSRVGEKRCDGLQLEPRRKPRTVEALLREPAVVKCAAGSESDATDRQAFQILRLVALADDQLGAAAADIHDEIRALGRCPMMRDAEVDQTRLLDPRDHLDGMAERFLCGGSEIFRIARAAQRIRADDADLVRLHVANRWPKRRKHASARSWLASSR